MHRAQGLTCDRTHALLAEGTAREELYVAASRARHHTHLYLTDPEHGYDHGQSHPSAALTDTDDRDTDLVDTDSEGLAARLAACIRRSHAEPSATEQLDPSQAEAATRRRPRRQPPTPPAPAHPTRGAPAATRATF